MAMFAGAVVESLSVGVLPVEQFHTRAANATRHRKCAKSYEITVEFTNGWSINDVMDHRASGSSRDCFRLRELPMVLKWFTETTDTRYAVPICIKENWRDTCALLDNLWRDIYPLCMPRAN